MARHVRRPHTILAETEREHVAEAKMITTKTEELDYYF